jgi:hypothetical protein
MSGCIWSSERSVLLQNASWKFHRDKEEGISEINLVWWLEINQPPKLLISESINNKQVNFDKKLNQDLKEFFTVEF